ncbi:MAG: dUTP diphosphatase [Pseudomonadales bacterium]|nr:dUTP diphosphatase [Pseudomonadales bacterium]
MNSKVDPNWVQARYPYLRAVAIEGAEAIEHHGWKWWKKQDKDLPQLQMELIDIWHFILSEVLLRSTDSDSDPEADLHAALESARTQSTVSFDGNSYQLTEMDLLSKLELLIALSVARRIELAVFAAIMVDCELSWTELFRQYVGKNVLNMFRQDKGYKQGNYQKLWQGREDNEYLVEIIHKLDANSADFKEAIYAELAAAYPD